VDELKLLAELRHETPPITGAAAQSARARLLAAAAGPPATRGQRSRMPSGLARRGRRVAAATALALVLTVGFTVTRDAGVDPEHPTQGRLPAVLPVRVANAGELGQRAARVVAGQPDLHPRPNQWTYVEVCWATPGRGTGGCQVGPGRETRRYWTRIDRKRVAIEYRGRIYQYPNHQRSSVYPWPTFAYLRRLPTDPQALLARLYATFSSPAAIHSTANFASRGKSSIAGCSAWPCSCSGPMWCPGVQAAIYQALPTIPGVRLQPDAVDAAGRHGVAFARMNGGRVREEIILDPETYQYLGWRRVAVKDFVDKGSTIAGRKNPHIAAGTVLEWQARTAVAIVDRPGQRHQQAAPVGGVE